MAESLDDLYVRWRGNPDTAMTLAMCDALRGSGRVDLVQEVGELTARQHWNSVPALIAAARMYMESDRLPDAQAVLVAAGKLSPRDHSVYRWLGEVLLRKGDAERAEKVLDRAVAFGGTDPETTLWMDRARVFKPMQARAGTQAVAAEVAKASPVKGANPNIFTPPPRPRVDSSSELETLVRSTEDVQFGLDLASSGSPPIVPAAGKPPAPYLAPAPSLESLAREAAPPTGTNLFASAPESARAAPQRSFETQPFSPPSSQREREAPPRAPPPVPLGPPPVPHGPPPAAQNPFAAPPAQNPFTDAAPPRDESPFRSDGKLQVPDPRDVLDALAIAGVFEQEQAGRPAGGLWERAAKGPRRLISTIVLSVATVLIVGGGIGTFFYVRTKRAGEHDQAEKILAQVDADLHMGVASKLPDDEKQIALCFDLESRSQHAALTWLHERATVGLLNGGADVAFENAIGRAKEVEIPEDKIAFAYVASFLFQGDTAGAAGVMPKWDAPSGNDAYYQLLAGSALERAGDQRALERYAAAARLDPALVPAEIALARDMAVDGDPRKAMELAKAFRAKYTDREEGVALVALAWARDPGRGDAPQEATDVQKMTDLPVSLRVVPHAMAAIAAIDKRAMADAKSELEKGLAVSESPGMASWIGAIALDTGDEALARKAALVAVSFSAVYPPARTLAARVALLGDRLDEALKATEELDQGSLDVAIVRAAVAYEKTDSDGLGRATDAIPTEQRKLPVVAPLAFSPDVLAGRAALPPDKLVDMADDEGPWADLVAMDIALDTGDTDTGDKIATQWAAQPPRALRSLRLSRLARYENKLADADKYSQEAMTAGTVTPRVLIERVFVLVADNKPTEVAGLLKAYPQVMGPLTKWVSAYALASNGKVEDARGKVSSDDPPPPTAPLLARTIAAAALGAMKDTRHGKDYVHAIAAAGYVNPDIAQAAQGVGLGQISRPRR